MMRRWMVAGAIIGVAVALGTAGALVRWPVADETTQRRVLRGVEQATGLAVAATGSMTIALLPKPTIEIGGVTLRGLSDAVMLDADRLRLRLDLWDLIQGRLAVTRAGLYSPTIALDLDRLQPIVTAMLGRAGEPPTLAAFHTAGLTVHGGLLRLVSRDPRRSGLVTDLSARMEWPSDAAEASLAGSGTWRGVAGEIGLDIARPAEALAGGQSLASARLRSAALDLDMEGTVSGAGDGRAAGRIKASTGDLPGFLRLIGMPTPQLDGLHQARLAGSMTLSGDALSFDPATLDLDDMAFEGAIAVHQLYGRTALAGTLATDRIDLDPFLAALPDMLAPGGGWSDAAIGTRSVAFDDIDLRISANAAKIASFVMEDGSLSLQSGDGRMEMSIGEARAYDGLLKGRIVATLDGEQTDIRAEATLSRLDLKALLKDVPGGYHATGTIASHIALAAKGRTAAELMRDVSGRGQLAVRDGAIGARLLDALVQAAPNAPHPSLALLAEGTAPFDAAALDVSVDHGTATIDDSSITWPTFRAAIQGTADLPGQTLDLRATVSPLDGETAPEAGGGYDIRGAWSDLQVKPARPRS